MVAVCSYKQLYVYLCNSYLKHHSYSYFSALARNCTCTTGEFSDCKQGVCIASSTMPKFACEMSVRLAPNRSVTDVKYYCLTGLSPPCHGKPQIEPSGDTSKFHKRALPCPSFLNLYTVYYACCGDKDECNRYSYYFLPIQRIIFAYIPLHRCLMPGALPYEAKLQIEINRNCNFSSLPTQTASLLLQSTIPSSSNVQSAESKSITVLDGVYCSMHRLNFITTF